MTVLPDGSESDKALSAAEEADDEITDKRPVVRAVVVKEDEITDKRPAVKAVVVRQPETFGLQMLPVNSNRTRMFEFSWTGGSWADEVTWPLPAIKVSPQTRLQRLGLPEARNYVSLIQNLLKSSGIYIVASLISPLVALVLTPFLTHNLSQTDYGALAVLITVISLTTGLTQLGLGSAFFRLYNYDYETKKDRQKVLSATVILLGIVALPVTVAMGAGSHWVSLLLLRDASYSSSIQLTALTVLMQNLTIPGFSWLRAEDRAASYSTLSIANVLVTFGATIVLVGKLHMGINGALLANAGGYAIVVVSTLPLILVRVGWQLRLGIVKELLSFGLPNVASLVSVWVLQLSDRYLLGLFTHSLSQVGSYSVAYTLGGVISTVVISPFMLAWPTTMDAIAKRAEAARVFQTVFRWFSCFLLLAAYGLSLASNLLLVLFFPPSYDDAFARIIIPIVAMSIMFYGIYTMFMTGGSIRRKPWLAVIFTTGAAIANVLLNVVLIPRFPQYGPLMAALSTLIAYALLALVAYIVIQRIYYVPYQVGLFLIGLMAGIALYLTCALLAFIEKGLLGWAIQIAGCCLYGGCLLLLAKAPARSVKEGTYQIERI